MKANRMHRVAALLASGEWVSCYELEKVGGRNGWRTAVSECRTVLKLPVSSPPKIVRQPNGVIETFYRLEA
jgi:hypothetical protein